MFKYDDISTEDTSMMPVYRRASYESVISMLPESFKNNFNPETGIMRTNMSGANHIINMWEGIKYPVPEGIRWKIEETDAFYSMLDICNDILVFEYYKANGKNTFLVTLLEDKFVYWLEYILPMFYHKAFAIGFGTKRHLVEFQKICSDMMEEHNSWNFNPSNRMLFTNMNSVSIKRIIDVMLDKYGNDAIISYVLIYLMTGTLVFEKYGENGADVTSYAKRNTTSFWSLGSVINFWKSAKLI